MKESHKVMKSFFFIIAPSDLSVDEKCPTSCNLPPPGKFKIDALIIESAILV